MQNSKLVFAAIFDMDGVLIDSPKLNWQANNEVLARYDVVVPTKDFHLFLGRTLKDAVEGFNKRYNLTLDYGEFARLTD